tara:strand:- start:429 stop:536 length:108 start_codon:yes stop_codon:yes gene_type:complete
MKIGETIITEIQKEMDRFLIINIICSKNSKKVTTN